MKKYILILIVGIIIGTGIGVVAYSYSASQIEFTPNDTSWNVTNVADAINSLKNDKATSVYETGEFSLYVKAGSYASITLNLKNTYTASDNARLVIYDYSPSAPLYPNVDTSVEKIVGNTKSIVIVNYAGNGSYSKTYNFKYKVIKMD